MKKRIHMEDTRKALEHAFWLHYIGDELYARRMLIHITNSTLVEGQHGALKEIPFFK